MDKVVLSPAGVFDFFAQINAIPRPSGKEDKMVEYLREFASKRGLEFEEDETGNALIRKPATKGMENRAITVLQSHMDMVCEKEAGLEFDFLNDPIQTYIDGEWLKAKGTTLGADDGIGCAMQLALLDAQDVEHGPIECLFTRAEETSLVGASGLSATLLKGDYLINLDSEDEGEIFISCAGSGNVVAHLPAEYMDAPEGWFFFKMQIKGLVGGHSGDDIIKKRANANILLARLLSKMQKKYGLLIADIQSGGLHNAIPRDGWAVCAVEWKDKEAVRVLFNQMTAEFEEEYAVTEKGMQFTLESAESQKKVLTPEMGGRLIKAVIGVQNGVLAMSQDIENFVETSTNLASIHLNESEVVVDTMQRSNFTSKRLATIDAVAAVFELAGASVDVNEGYPGWFLDPNSEFLKIAVKAYKNLFGKEPLVKAIHAGLECGLFTEKYPRMDMVSVGPTLRGVHSPDEKLLIPTVKMVWDHVLEILKDIPVKG